MRLHYLVRPLVCVVMMLCSYGAFAATINFNISPTNLASLNSSGTCSGTWSYSGGSRTFTCSGQVSFQTGDQISTNTSSGINLSANAGITATNNLIGSSTNRISLISSYGQIQIYGQTQLFGNIQTESGGVLVQGSSNAARASITGNISSEAAVSVQNLNQTGNIQATYGSLTLTNTSLTGSLTTSGTGSVSSSSVNGAASIRNGMTSSASQYGSTLTITNGTLNTSNSTYNGNVTVSGNITTNNDVFMADVTSTNGALNLTGGSVTGMITTPCCTLTTNNTNLAGGATVQSGINITGGIISGDYTMTSNNPAVVNNVTMTSGSITSASTVTINNSTLGSDTSPVLVTSVSGSITVSNSDVYGDLVTPDYDKVYVNGSSEVVGSCIPVDEPLYACGGVATVTRDAYWRFDEVLWNGTADEVKDSSLEQQDGRARNSAVVSQLTPSPASCTYGDFQRGSSSSGHPFVEVDRSSYFHDSDEFGFTLWLKMSSSAQASGRQTIMAYGDKVSSGDGRFQLTRESNNNLRFSIRMTGDNVRYVEVSGGSIFNDQWQHVAFSYSKNNRRMRLYVNNLLVDDTPNSSIGSGNNDKTPNNGNGDLSVGALPDGTEGIRGQIDEVRFFGRELTTADVKTMFEQASNCTNECFTENFADDANWYLTQRNSTPPSLRSSPSRLRLTENTQNQSTSITFKRSFPAAGNKMTIEFDHYAYGGNGADGIALVLSDAAVTPVPGSYGGSLGYAQRTNVSPAQSGFAGGWLGIGFDEFGNYSQATEGRVGGTSARPHAIGVRAASSTNYGWLGGTNTLSPILSSAGSTLARGDRYRITIDSRTTSPQTVVFQLERRLAGGTSYSTLLTSTDLLSLGQPVPPENLLLSYTGSTGDNTNFHEITNIQVCTQQPSVPVEIGDPVHHFELTYANNGLTCEAEEILVKACADAACNTTVTDEVTATISATNGGTFVGGNSLTFTGSSTVYLRQTNTGETTLAVSGASNPTVCDTPDCKISFSHAGFKFYATDNATGGLSNQVAGVQGGGFLRAVKTNTDTMACEARTVGPRNVTFSYDCLNPGSCSAGFNNVLQLKDNTVGTTTETLFDGDEEGNNKTVSLTFRADGYAPLGINYFDVGQLSLSASLALPASGNDPAVILAGQSNPFVVRPHRINVTTALSSATADPANAANPQTLATDAGFVAAGEAFQLYVSPVNAQGNLTPNYGNEDEAESVEVQFGQLLYPTPGENGELNQGSNYTKVSSGSFIDQFHSADVSWDEVGTITLLAKVQDDDYLGTGLGAAVASDPYTVGRFYPSYFSLDSSSLTNSCNSFSYMGQPDIGLAYLLSARNVDGEVTENYGVNFAPKATVNLVLENNDAGTDLADRLNETPGIWQDGVMQVAQTNLNFSRLADATVPDGPFAALQAGVQISDSFDSRDFDAEDKDMDAGTQGVCGGFCNAVRLSGALDVRYGRLVLKGGNVADAAASGPTLVPLAFSTEFWSGTAFVVNTNDSCTEIDPAAVSFDSVGQGDGLTVVGDSYTLDSGVTAADSLSVSIPQPGSTEPPLNGVWPVFYAAPDWLKYNWQEESGTQLNDPPFSEVSVGRFRGNKRQIFWQERLN